MRTAPPIKPQAFRMNQLYNINDDIPYDESEYYFDEYNEYYPEQYQLEQNDYDENINSYNEQDESLLTDDENFPMKASNKNPK
ncbi:hypothetical protein RR46_00079 [Papilio xuthus]|uniref:Uncharacterized protein n=1 Tax=Papilio xuthus TaxID=66420 RepID=A0A0N0PF77_PAPXU|nr:hypothetical protein RR46_00079 [Papilio xuthus]